MNSVEGNLLGGNMLLNMVVKAEEENKGWMQRGSDCRRVGHVLIYFVDLFSNMQLHNRTASLMGADFKSD